MSCPFSKIPGKPDLPIFGDTLSFIFTEPIELINKKKNKHGEVYKMNVFNKDTVVIAKPNLTKWALLDHAKDFNSKEAWENVLKKLFPNGLMLMDGAKHKYHRSIIAEVFKKEPMEGYLKLMTPIVDKYITELGNQEHLMFPMFKELTLKIALEVFFGLDPKDEIKDINQAITNIVKAATSIQVNLPFTTYGKGIRARKYLVQFFKKIIGDRRANPNSDLFSKLCLAVGDDGKKLTDAEVIDHLIFILMAAHDTTSSTLTSLSYFLAKNEDWQNTVRAETEDVNQDVLSQKLLRSFDKTNLAVKETLRIYPPLTSVSRISNKDISYDDWSFPKGTFFSISLSYFQKDKDIWTEPERWDPERFNKERKEDKKCPYAYAPFGAGLHYCIGYAFAEMQINLIMGKLLQSYRLKLRDEYELTMRAIPLHEPKDGLPLRLEPLEH